jgi:hypothetical protein
VLCVSRIPLFEGWGFGLSRSSGTQPNGRGGQDMRYGD